MSSVLLCNFLSHVIIQNLVPVQLLSGQQHDGMTQHTTFDLVTGRALRSALNDVRDIEA